MQNIIEKVEDWAGEKIKENRRSYGGDIAQSQVLIFESGHKYFLKTGSRNDQMFPTEANSLRELSKSKAIRIPQVLLAEPKFLLIEYIEQGQKSSSFFEDFGRRFAQIHRYKADHFGLFEDNFIGHTQQQNIPQGEQATDWTKFYFEKRLLFQFKLAENQGLSSPTLKNAFKNIENNIESILKTDDATPSLLHGDLWSGNYLADENGNPVIIDPAVYYGHREADLAMTKVFGGFSPSFYRAYNDAYPLADGYEYRENIYKLYHILNHLNLFGMSYHGQAVSLLQSYL